MAPLFPRDSIYELQRSVHGVDLLAFLSPPDGVSEKRLSKFVETAFHPLRPWVAGVEPKGSGVVWNYETKEVVHEFSLEVSLDVDSAEDDAAAPPPPPKATGLLTKSSSPTATTYMRSNKSKGGALHMLFYDHEAIVATTKSVASRVCFDEWIVVLTATHVVLCDMNQTSAIRSVSPDDLHRQAPCSIEILPAGLLAIGCQDGKVRIWSPQLWRVVDTIDTGSTKDVQHVLFLPPQSLDGSRSRSGSSATNSAMRANYAAQYLVATTLDGRVGTWRIGVLDSGASVECVKVADVELKEALKSFDASSGVSELQLHANHDMLSASTRDGTVFFLDLTPLIRQAKAPSLVGVLPASKLPGALVIPGPRKASFILLSIASSTSALAISELATKGRLAGRDNAPSNVLEFAASTSIESRDLKLSTNQAPALAKKLKILSLTSSRRDPNDLCVLTTLGLAVFKTTCLPDVRPVFIARGTDRAPVLAFPSTAKVALQILGDEQSSSSPPSKLDEHRLQSGSDAPNEKLKTPLLLPCPSDASYLAAVLPASQHMELLHMDAELRNQKSISMTSAFSGNAIALAWHPTLQRFAMLVPQDLNSRRLTRSQTSAHITPRRRGFMFGGSTKNATDEASGADAKARNHMARLMTLAVFEIARESGQVEMLEENCSSSDDRLLHIFSGPLLGVVKFEASDDSSGGSSGHDSGGGSMRSLTDSPAHHDSPSAMMRTRRTESSVFAAITSPSFGASSNASASASEASTLSEVDTSDIRKTYLEFYDWTSTATTAANKLTLGSDTMRRIGSALECPLALEWERTTHRFVALVYPTSVKIYRATAAPPALVCLHDIPTSQPAQSLAWVHHTLFFATDDVVKCCVVSKTRCFTFDLVSSLVTTEPRAARDAAALEFPQPQSLPRGATTILGVHSSQLLLAGPVQALHTIDLSNRVLQCCLLISRGKDALARELAATLSTDVVDWLGSVFEAFGCVHQALQLPRLSLALKINICIKHNLLAELAQLLETPQRDSLDSSGSSLFQRACVCLHRGARSDAQPLQALAPMLMAAKRYNDAIFAATLLQDDELLVQAYSAREDWRAAHRVAKHRSGAAPLAETCLAKWNADLAAPAASWRVLLEAQHVRPPETIALVASGVALRVLRSMQDVHALERDAAELQTPVETLRVLVRGQFVRKRKLSKGLIFGDIKLDDDALLEVMIRAHDGGLSVEEIKHINWQVHLGDRVATEGFVQRKEPHGLLFVLRAVTVELAWSSAHPGVNFDHKLDPERASAEATEAAAVSLASLSLLDPAANVKGSLALAPASQARATDKYTNIVTINGMNACKYYFSGAGGVNCLRGAQCHFWHGEPQDFAANKREWLAKRLAQRRAASHIAGDDADPHAKVLKAQRGRMFCDWLVETVGVARLAAGAGVVDVAGGKGDIPIQLWHRRGIPTTLIDPRPMKLSKASRKIVAQSPRPDPCRQLLCYLDDATVATHAELFASCSMLLGMHPDEATEVIVDTALAHRKPFAIVPCCVMSRQFPDRVCADGTPVATYEAFVTYLREKHAGIQTAFLPFAGRNQVLYLIDYD